MTKGIFIMMIAAFGFFLIPNVNSFVSANFTTEMSCCDKEMADDCCQNHHSDSDSHDNSCDGDCGNSSCHCPSGNSTVLLLSKSEPSSVFSFDEKLNLSYSEANLPSVLLSIWAPPKIS